MNHSALIEKYKTCKSSKEISVMQDTILKELEQSYQESREAQGGYTF